MTVSNLFKASAMAITMTIAIFSTASTAEKNIDPAESQHLERKVRDAIRRNGLTKVSDKCLALKSEKDDKNVYVFAIREIHSPACGGDTDTSPLLFIIKTDAEGKHMRSDAMSDDGEMTALKP